MSILEIIEAKKRGRELSAAEIEFVVDADDVCGHAFAASSDHVNRVHKAA